jgi:hypothetical protein
MGFDISFPSNISVPSFDQVMNGSKILLTNVSNLGYDKTGLESSTVCMLSVSLSMLTTKLAIVSWKSGKKVQAVGFGCLAIGSGVAATLAVVSKVYLFPTQRESNTSTGPCANCLVPYNGLNGSTTPDQNGTCQVTYNYLNGTTTPIFG